MPNKKQPPFVGIRLEGGIIQSVFSSHQEMVGKKVIVIDYDTDGADSQNDLTKVRQSDDTYDEAYVSVFEIAQSEMGADDFIPSLEEIRHA